MSRGKFLLSASARRWVSMSFCPMSDGNETRSSRCQVIREH